MKLTNCFVAVVTLFLIYSKSEAAGPIPLQLKVEGVERRAMFFAP